MGGSAPLCAASAPSLHWLTAPTHRLLRNPHHTQQSGAHVTHSCNSYLWLMKIIIFFLKICHWQHHLHPPSPPLICLIVQLSYDFVMSDPLWENMNYFRNKRLPIWKVFPKYKIFLQIWLKVSWKLWLLPDHLLSQMADERLGLYKISNRYHTKYHKCYITNTSYRATVGK